MVDDHEACTRGLFDILTEMTVPGGLPQTTEQTPLVIKRPPPVFGWVTFFEVLFFSGRDACQFLIVRVGSVELIHPRVVSIIFDVYLLQLDDAPTEQTPPPPFSERPRGGAFVQ